MKPKRSKESKKVITLPLFEDDADILEFLESKKSVNHGKKTRGGMYQYLRELIREDMKKNE